MTVLRHIDLTQIIVAGLATFATVVGVRQARAGQRDTAQQQVAANRLQADQLQLEEYRALVPDLRQEADRAKTARDEARDEADQERSRRIEVETALRLANHQHEEQMRRLTSDIQGLRMIVQDEIARAASDEAWGQQDPPGQ